jgi:hypothetical protein
LRLHYGGRSVILRSNQLNVVFLAAIFILNCGPQFGIGLGKGVLAVKHSDNPDLVGLVR